MKQPTSFASIIYPFRHAYFFKNAYYDLVTFDVSLTKESKNLKFLISKFLASTPLRRLFKIHPKVDSFDDSFNFSSMLTMFLITVSKLGMVKEFKFYVSIYLSSVMIYETQTSGSLSRFSL